MTTDKNPIHCPLPEKSMNDESIRQPAQGAGPLAARPGVESALADIDASIAEIAPPEEKLPRYELVLVLLAVVTIGWLGNTYLGQQTSTTFSTVGSW